MEPLRLKTNNYNYIHAKQPYNFNKHKYLKSAIRVNLQAICI